MPDTTSQSLSETEIREIVGPAGSVAVARAVEAAVLAKQRAEEGVPSLQCIGYVSRHYGQTILDLPAKDTQPVYVVAAQPEAVPQGGQVEPSPISRSEWIEQAAAFFEAAGDSPGIALEQARWLCNQQDWAGAEVGDPREEAQEDVQGRPRPPSPQPPVAQSAEPVAWVSLTDEDRERAMKSMPDMLEGFRKTWGWLHFAKAIEAICREKNHPAQPAQQPLTEWDARGVLARLKCWHRLTTDEADDLIEFARAHGIGTAKPAQPEDENEVLRQKVKTLAREAWAWSKACEAESMKLTAVRKAIADAFLPMSRSGLWTKEHSQSYPSKAAEIINAARSIFDVEAAQPALPEDGITAPAGGGEERA